MEVVKRSYSAPRREAAAKETRRLVLEAAHALFARQGYAATTIDQIAETAQVSRPTVFAVGSKAELLKLSRDIAMAGDDAPVPVAQRRGFQEILAEPDPREALRRYAAHVAAVNGRYADLDEVLHRAAGSDPDLDELWQTSEDQRRRGAEFMVASLRTKASLALPHERAVDLLALLIAPSQYHHLVITRGWAQQHYVDWLASALPKLLLT